MDGSPARGQWRALLRYVVRGLVLLGATMGCQLPPRPETSPAKHDGTAWRYRPAVPLSADERVSWTELVRLLRTPSSS